MTRHSRRAAIAVVPVAALLAVTSCSSSSEDTEESASSTEVTYPTVEFTVPGEGIGLGEEDQEITGQIPEPLHVAEITPIGADQILGIEGGFGKLEMTVNALDPATGEVTTRITVGPGIWDPVVHGFVGDSASDPAVIAAEVWRPRGSRGAADFTVSTYSGNLLEPKEASLPDVARVHSREGSNAVTSDGKYFVSWDDGLYGIRVVDLEAGTESGAIRIVGCGPFTWMVGHDLYSVCEDTRELLHVNIGEDGVPTEVGRGKVLPDDFVSARKTTFAEEAKKALLVSENGDVYLFDVSGGLPTDTVAPIGNAGDPSGRFSENVVNADASRIAISYTDSIVHPDSARGGSVAKVVLFDAANLAPVKSLALADMGIESFSSMAYSVDGTTFYVLGDGQEVDGEAPQKLVGFDASTGAQVSSVDIDGAVTPITDLITPEVME
ncbi:hypothetical protein CH253_05710 [Rhodococcus sp. 06-156-3C]|uniref:hypothetical protein n=1 Tax=Nocardiaceae TaxID=85025 RepID=UPI000522EDE6|nr:MULTISPECIES: hypothetical protein [Rhodococcus]OZD11185.1 hypothetical protein CH280_20865 [Rhodococcus sp. 06-156-4C]OZD14601.1 hypothetical protein CH248_24940 [Rhodococcus sp. 06-156-4a]OZD24935.1 hypothetical protein CH253_05710 [Rhodococcus sp. 06-156-3C]OZD27909.1 hypothetical protein CH247_21850 [Rhodococcus sp. 06-156-3b]OZD39891.1 hypothetical protein CH284_05430 [Rhodococcus sp. 06-156-3]